MELKNIRNLFNPDVTEVSLSVKEVEFIAMLISGVKRPRIKQILSMTKSDLDTLYNKFGLFDKTRVRYMQVATIAGANRFITDDILNESSSYK